MQFRSAQARRSARTRERIRALADHGLSRDDPALRDRIIVDGLLELMRAHDPLLPLHGVRTAVHAVALGQASGLTCRELGQLRRAALLHDLGLVLVPAALRDKDGPLTGEEYALLQSHPRLGAELLDPFPALHEAAVWIALHHERWDGCGYPFGLRGALVPLCSRILAVADTFDRLTTPWRPNAPGGLARGTALRLLQGRGGTQLDPELVRRFACLVTSMDAPGLRARGTPAR